MKKLMLAMLVGLLGLGLAGCNLGSVTAEDVGEYVAGIDPEQAVAMATNLLGLPAVQDLANAIMADPELVADLTNAWGGVEDDYVTPDEIEEGQPPAAGGGTPSTALPALSVARPLAGYGRVNRWCNGGATLAESLAILKSDLDACKKHNVRIYAIEFASWGRYSANGHDREWSEAAYKLLLDYCRANGMWAFVSAFNDNQGSRSYQRKYGDPGIDLEHSPEMVAWAIGVLKRHGPANVLLQPVAESGRTSYGTKLELSMGKEFAALGFKLVYNHKSRPSSTPAPFHYRATHPFKVTDLYPGSLVVSDTGTIIQSLNEGLEGKGKPAALSAWAKRMADSGVYAVVDYAFKWPGPTDEAAIAAMGSAVPKIDAEPTVPENPAPGDLTGVTWLHFDVSSWPQTATLDAAVSANGSVTLAYDKAKVWPAVDGLNANP